MHRLLRQGVCGAQVREGEGPSYFNPLEAATLVGLVVGLLDWHSPTPGSSSAGVTAADVGVIATYRKQVLACA